MRKFSIIFAIATVFAAGAANAASTSSSTGDVETFNPNKQSLFGGYNAGLTGLDVEPTASVGAPMVAASGQRYTESTYINGRSAEVQFQIVDGQREMTNIEYRSSDR